MRDKNYQRIIPASVLPEVAHLLTRRLGYDATRRFITNLAIEKPPIVELVIQDYERIAAIINQYTDLRLDFADASILALAERLNITNVLTLDRRDFSVLRPKHCTHLELLP